MIPDNNSNQFSPSKLFPFPYHENTIPSPLVTHSYGQSSTPSHTSESRLCEETRRTTFEPLCEFLESIHRGAGACANGAEWCAEDGIALVQWAQANGWLRSPDSILSLIHSSASWLNGQEHIVHYVHQTGRVLKITRPPKVGISFGIPGTLEAYVENVLQNNAIFGDTMEFEGILAVENQISVLISQPYIHGDRPTLREIETWFRAQGFTSLGPERYYHPELDVTIADAHSGNLIRVAPGELIPIDLHVLEGYCPL